MKLKTDRRKYYPVPMDDLIRLTNYQPYFHLDRDASPVARACCCCARTCCPRWPKVAHRRRPALQLPPGKEKFLCWFKICQKLSFRFDFDSNFTVFVQTKTYSLLTVNKVGMIKHKSALQPKLTWNRRMSLGFPAFFKQFWLHFKKNLRKNLRRMKWFRKVLPFPVIRGKWWSFSFSLWMPGGFFRGNTLMKKLEFF